MKKMTAIVMSAMFLAMPVTMSFAQAEKPKAEAKAAVEVIKGEIVSIDVAKGEVVIKDEAGATKTVTYDNKEKLAELKVGEKVKARVKAGTTVAEKISKQGKNKANKSK